MADIEQERREKLIEDLGPLFGEAHRLALNAWSLMRKVAETNWAKESLSEETRLAEMASLEALRREVVLGLCRLDDDGSGLWSFHKAKKLVSEAGFQQEFVREVNRRVKDFREQVNPYKNEHRNAYISHLAKEKFVNQFGVPIAELDEGLKACVRSAFQIVDVLFGEPVGFGWIRSDPEAERIDLRSKIEG